MLTRSKQQSTIPEIDDAQITHHSFLDLAPAVVARASHHPTPWAKLTRLATQLGVTNIYSSELVDEAFVTRIGDLYAIAVNRHQPLTRKRFAVAHEIAHLLLDPRLQRAGRPRTRPTAQEKRSAERQCDNIASQLLMPEVEFREVIAKYPMSVASVPPIAKHFGTSIESTAIRLASISQRNFIVLKVRPDLIGRGKQKIIWSSFSETARQTIKPYAFIPRGQHVDEIESLNLAFQRNSKTRAFESWNTGTLRGRYWTESKAFGSSQNRFILTLINMDNSQASLSKHYTSTTN